MTSYDARRSQPSTSWISRPGNPETSFEIEPPDAGEIAARFAHAWPTTTRHLRVLEEAGLLRHEKDGRTRRYTIDRERLALVSEWLGWFET